jgi:hypothetical protein
MLFMHENLNEECSTGTVTGCACGGYDRQSRTFPQPITLKRYINYGVVSIKNPINTGQTGRSADYYKSVPKMGSLMKNFTITKSKSVI